MPRIIVLRYQSEGLSPPYFPAFEQYWILVDQTFLNKAEHGNRSLPINTHHIWTNIQILNSYFSILIEILMWNFNDCFSLILSPAKANLVDILNNQRHSLEVMFYWCGLLWIFSVKSMRAISLQGKQYLLVEAMILYVLFFIFIFTDNRRSFILFRDAQ